MDDLSACRKQQWPRAGSSVSRGCAPICLGIRQERQLPDARISSAGIGEELLKLILGLFLLESLTSNEASMIKAGVPEQFRQPTTKLELAIEEIDRIRRRWSYASAVYWRMRALLGSTNLGRPCQAWGR